MRRSPLGCISRELCGFCIVTQGFICNETRLTKDVKPLKERPPHPPLRGPPSPLGKAYKPQFNKKEIRPGGGFLFYYICILFRRLCDKLVDLVCDDLQTLSPKFGICEVDTCNKRNVLNVLYGSRFKQSAVFRQECLALLKEF